MSYKTLHNETDTENRRRLIRALEIAHFSSVKQVDTNTFLTGKQFIFGISQSREIVRQRITNRLHIRLKEGMIEEVQALLDSCISASRLIRYGLEYMSITEYLLKQYSYNEMVRLLNIAIQQFSKRQMTWFRVMERRGLTISWIDELLRTDEKMAEIEKVVCTKK